MDEKKLSLQKFLDETKKDEIIWFLVPAGLIFGNFARLQNDDSTVALYQPYIYTGQNMMTVEFAYVPINEVSAWGTGQPVFDEYDVK